MHSPSEKQNEIIKNSKKSQNIICDAVAGSGKTTTILWVAKENPKKNVIMLTYNKHLQAEVCDRVKSMKIRNIMVHTYHGAAVKYYNNNAWNNTELQKVIDRNDSLQNINGDINILIIDEAQDMNITLFKFTKKFIIDLQNPNLLIFGDKRQSIYEFLNADSRFLTLSENIWQKPFLKLPMRISYRLTNQIAWFINDVMLHEKYVESCKDGPPIYYFKCDPYYHASRIAQTIINLMNHSGFLPEDIFVLSPSITNKSAPFISLEHKLVKMKIPCFVSISDDQELDDTVIRGKTVFTTFHQSKGRERKLVIVYGFDSSYFKYFCKEKPSEYCPSELYVAVSRSINTLIVIESNRPNSTPLPFLKYNKIIENQGLNINFILLQKSDSKENNPEEITPSLSAFKKDHHSTSVSELIKYLNDETTFYCENAVNCLFETYIEKKYDINMNKNVCCEYYENKLIEAVSHLNGIIIPEIWQVKNKPNSLTRLHSIIKNFHNSIDTFEYPASPCRTIPEYLYLANYYVMRTNRIHHSLAQINRYDWLTEDIVDSCCEVLNEIVSKKIKLEIDIGLKNGHFPLLNKFIREKMKPNFGTLEIKGIIDAIDKENIWEFKCVNELTLEHKLQLLIYAWIWKIKEEQPKDFKLLNIRTGEVLKLKANHHLIDDVVCVLLNNKYKTTHKISDEEFIMKCLTH